MVPLADYMVPVYIDVLKRFTFSYSRESVGDIFRSPTCNLGELIGLDVHFL